MSPTEGGCCSSRGSKWVGMAEWSTYQQSESWVRVLVTPVALLDSLITFQVCSGLHTCLAHSDLKDLVHKFLFISFALPCRIGWRKKGSQHLCNFFNLYSSVLGYLLYCSLFMIWEYGEQGVLPVYILALYPLVLSSYESFLYSTADARLTCKSLWCSILTNSGNMKL